MATEVNARGAYVKIRHPWGAFLLVLVTLGIYYLFWYFFINRELRDLGQASADSGDNRIEVNPWISLLAVTFWVVPNRSAVRFDVPNVQADSHCSRAR